MALSYSQTLQTQTTQTSWQILLLFLEGKLCSQFSGILLSSLEQGDGPLRAALSPYMQSTTSNH